MARDDEKPSLRGSFTHRFIQDWAELWRGVWDDHVDGYDDVWRRCQDEDQSSGKLVGEWMKYYARWLRNAERLMTFPFLWSPKEMAGIPTIVFLIDEMSEAADAQELVLDAGLPRGVVQATDLLRVSPELRDGARPLEGAEQIAAKRVSITRAAADRLKVGLRGLGGRLGPKDEGRPRVGRGVYSGALFVVREQHKSTVALIQVIVQPGDTRARDGRGPQKAAAD